MNNFVVYAYCRADGTFYYIGKGSPRRPYGKRKEGIKPPKDKSKILLLHTGLPEETAFIYEQRLILTYGRKDLGTGLLRNMTNGGEGVAGWVPGEEWRRKKSESMSGENNPMFGVSLPGKPNPTLAEYNRLNNPLKDLRGEKNPMYGKERSDLSDRNKERCPSKGTKWFNNGAIDKRFDPDNVPEGFVLGRLKVARGHKRPDLSERNKKRGLLVE